MEHSNTYNNFIQQTKAIGSEKMQGYSPYLLEDIYDYEHDEVEKIIWDTFTKKGDCDLAFFLPQLKNYNGIAALKRKMRWLPFDSYNNLCVLIALYGATDKAKYFNSLKTFYYQTTGVVRKICISRMAHFAKREQVYDFLMQVYLDDSDQIARSDAIEGILWADERIDDLDDMKELISKMDLIKKFDSDLHENRKLALEKYKAGQI